MEAGTCNPKYPMLAFIFRILRLGASIQRALNGKRMRKIWNISVTSRELVTRLWSHIMG